MQLALGMTMFATSHMTIGATLLLVVLVMQTVLLLSLRVAAVVVAIVPLGHLGMTLPEGVRAGLATLVGTLFGAVLAELLVREQRARDQLAEAHAAEEALDEVRRSVSALREPQVDRPLPEGLEGLAAESSAAGIATALEVVGAARTLPAEVEEALYRTAQEGLTNMRKHAEATRAWLTLDYRDAAIVALEVRDDGTGTKPDTGAGRGFGLLGLRERAARLDGRLTIDAAPGRGLTLRVEVPG